MAGLTTRNVIQALKSRGFETKEIQKIKLGNFQKVIPKGDFLRLCQPNLGEADWLTTWPKKKKDSRKLNGVTVREANIKRSAEGDPGLVAFIQFLNGNSEEAKYWNEWRFQIGEINENEPKGVHFEGKSFDEVPKTEMNAFPMPEREILLTCSSKKGYGLAQLLIYYAIAWIKENVPKARLWMQITDNLLTNQPGRYLRMLRTNFKGFPYRQLHKAGRDATGYDDKPIYWQFGTADELETQYKNFIEKKEGPEEVEEKKVAVAPPEVEAKSPSESKSEAKGGGRAPGKKKRQTKKPKRIPRPSPKKKPPIRRKERKAYRSRSMRAGLVFPVGRISRFMRQGRYATRIGTGSAIYLTAVLEYVTAEVLELAGNFTRDSGRIRISPRDIMLAIRNDVELERLLQFVTIPSSGTLSWIHAPLLTESQYHLQMSKIQAAEAESKKRREEERAPPRATLASR
jgi:histone H2A